MVDVALIVNASTNSSGKQTRVLAGLYELDELGEQMRRQGAQVGMDQAEVWVDLSDGGAGLENWLKVYFPRCELILDFYHAAGHLNDLAKALHPDDDEASRELAQRWCHRLKHEGGAKLLAELTDWNLKGHSAEAREVHRQVSGYIRNNVERMDYPRYRAEGWLIGSGHVEAACKSVVGQRLKGNGMRWGEAGADAVCHLRALFRSEPSQWEAF